jgi:hypothetical protein
MLLPIILVVVVLSKVLLYIIAAIILPEEEIEERDLKDVIHPEESGEDKEA